MPGPLCYPEKLDVGGRKEPEGPLLPDGWLLWGPGDPLSHLSAAPAPQKARLQLAAMAVPLSRCPSSSILPTSC